ncbi:hypothetical protein LDENG_00179970 [Lucifuga dentata]|nr:hypothetical protein LDENG_00179970 [Lucifuga dentata]
MEHCRSLETDPTSDNLHFNHLYDLPDMDFGTNFYDLGMIQDVQTDEVWVGLRFLVGQWLQVNGKPLSDSILPECPEPRMHCATMSKTGKLSAFHDCQERRNFICLARH